MKQRKSIQNKGVEETPNYFRHYKHSIGYCFAVDGVSVQPPLLRSRKEEIPSSLLQLDDDGKRGGGGDGEMMEVVGGGW